MPRCRGGEFRNSNHEGRGVSAPVFGLGSEADQSQMCHRPTWPGDDSVGLLQDQLDCCEVKSHVAQAI
jgi:hypothetical protein